MRNARQEPKAADGSCDSGQARTRVRIFAEAQFGRSSHLNAPFWLNANLNEQRMSSSREIVTMFLCNYCLMHTKGAIRKGPMAGWIVERDVVAECSIPNSLPTYFLLII